MLFLFVHERIYGCELTHLYLWEGEKREISLLMARKTGSSFPITLCLSFPLLFLTRTYTLQAKSSFLFVSTDRVLADASTDTLPILDRRFTDILPTHRRCYRDRLSVDLSTEGNPMIGRYIDDIAADARPTLACYSADTRPILGGYIDRDIDRQSTVSRSTYRAPVRKLDKNVRYGRRLISV